MPRPCENCRNAEDLLEHFVGTSNWTVMGPKVAKMWALLLSVGVESLQEPKSTDLKNLLKAINDNPKTINRILDRSEKIRGLLRCHKDIFVSIGRNYRAHDEMILTSQELATINTDLLYADFHLENIETVIYRQNGNIREKVDIRLGLNRRWEVIIPEEVQIPEPPQNVDIDQPIQIISRRSSERLQSKSDSVKEPTTLEKARNLTEDNLDIKDFERKGRGVIAVSAIEKGSLVVEYKGDLIDGKEAKNRETKYQEDRNVGCYMYYFKFNETAYCIDATEETGFKGRLLNHSKANANLKPKVLEIDGKPRVFFFAIRDIVPGTECLYDYGDHSKSSLEHNPWLKE